MRGRRTTVRGRSGRWFDSVLPEQRHTLDVDPQLHKISDKMQRRPGAPTAEFEKGAKSGKGEDGDSGEADGRVRRKEKSSREASRAEQGELKVALN